MCSRKFDSTTGCCRPCNIKALQTYYYYDYSCYQNRDDPACARIISSNNYASAFVVSLSLIIVAHLSNSLIFWMTLSPKDHPLRLAYFLPLIHLWRLLKVFWQTFSCNGIKDLHDSHQEWKSLYNVLGASLETVPQLILQFHIAISLGNYSASLVGAVPIPKILIISIVASILSGTYNGSMAVLSLVPKYTLAGKAYITIAAGVHTIAVMSAQTIIVGALLTAYYSALWLIAYGFVAIIFPWIFFGVLLRMHNYSFNGKKWLRPAQSFALAHVSLFIGPMYVILKGFRRSPYLYSLLILGTLLQTSAELLGIGGVLLLGRYLPYSGVPCRLAIWKSRADNKYLTCHSFVGALCPSLLLLILTSVFFIVVDKKEDNFPRLDVNKMEMPSTMPHESFISDQEQEQGHPINMSSTMPHESFISDQEQEQGYPIEMSSTMPHESFISEQEQEQLHPLDDHIRMTSTMPHESFSDQEQVQERALLY